MQLVEVSAGHLDRLDLVSVNLAIVSLGLILLVVRFLVVLHLDLGGDRGLDKLIVESRFKIVHVLRFSNVFGKVEIPDCNS